MFGIIRIILGVLFFLIVFLTTMSSKTNAKKIISLIIIAFGISFALSFVPFENILVVFPSAESAYKYYNSMNADVAMVLEGENSSLVVEKKKASVYSGMIVPRCDSGWKLGMGIDTKRIWESHSSECNIVCYQYKNTGEYYVCVMPFKEIQTISDNKNSEFISIETDEKLLLPQLTLYYAYVQDLGDEYQIDVNGVRMSIKDRGRLA